MGENFVIKQGDVVRLRDSNTLMHVTSVDNDIAVCVWAPDQKYNQRICKVSELVRVEDTSEIWWGVFIAFAVFFLTTALYFATR